MPLPTLSQLRRLADRPPGYVLRRVGQELGGELTRWRLAQARIGRGPVAAANVVPGGLPAAAAATADAVGRLGAFAEAIALTRNDRALRADVERRGGRALEGLLEVFGDRPVAVGSPPAWDLDPLTRTRWPAGFHRRLDVRDIERSTDIKRVWEVSRLRHCVALAQAATVLESGPARAGLEADLSDWRARNPVGWTVNWTVGMEVALRAVNLICIDGVLLAGGRALAQREALVASVYQHGWFLYRNLEVSDVNGNHFLADAVGLVWLGAYFGDVGEASRWLARGREMTIAAAREQVLDDGLDHEGSLPYHVLVLELFLLALVADGDRLASIRGPVGRMLDAAVAFVDAAGSVPDLGDDDGGRVAAFVDTPSRDARRVLALGAALLCHAGAAACSRDGHDQDALWLAGRARLETARRRGPHRRAGPVHLTAGGLVVLGGGADRVVVDVGPIGFRGRGGHGHVDGLSFVAWVGGELAVRDSGTGSYTGDAVLRNELRDAPAHNLVIVDGLPYAQIGGPDRLWAVDGDAPPRVVDLSAAGGEERLVARQTLPAAGGQASVERAWTLTRGRLAWRDTVAAPAGATVSHLLQLPDLCRHAGGEIVHPRLRYEGRWPANAVLTVVPCRWSDAYGACRPGSRAIVTYTSSGEPVEVSWSITATSA